MRKTVSRFYYNAANEKVIHSKNYGEFYPEIHKNPTKYIVEQPELK
jgi:hypothetical protein